MIHFRRVIKKLSAHPASLKVAMIFAVICLPIASYSIYTVTANVVNDKTTALPQNVIEEPKGVTSPIADDAVKTSVEPSDAEQQQTAEAGAAPTQAAPTSSAPAVSNTVPVPPAPKLEGYKPTYPNPQPEVILSQTGVTMPASATSHTITAYMNDASVVHWLGGGRHDYLVVTPGQEEDMPVKLVFEHGPGDMIRNTVRFHFVTSYAARPASYGFAIYAHDGVRGLDIRKEIYVRVE